MTIDSHQHFWMYDPDRDSWITEEMSAIRRHFMPTDLRAELHANGIDGVIAVQAASTPEETQFLVDLSTMYAMIKGVVGWVDLRAENLEEQLENFRSLPITKGFRHIVEAEADPDYLVREDVQRGLCALTKYDYTFDLLIHPRHFQQTLACVAQNPKLQFVLDHMAKPDIKSGEVEQWASFIADLSKYPNVVCKVSGLAKEADWSNWELSDFTAYIDHVIQHFGKDRVMFGSDWPVSLLAATYRESKEIAASRLDDFTSEERAAFWGETARRIYKF
ncbi:amidohydrolase family protein [Sphingobacterium sp. lm-10]|uniref:amidohydrolase family protein n=1 Tax=Sphingobacterium sp. lm-10 TaxID=2944904 RepID=UPI002021EB6E|nr:amidohydrolase family protein [Sphingobacterium sp. lm-10]MCL7987646.1 amidohydrolase family protein [Sphingobacterium sp. lm-10]